MNYWAFIFKQFSQYRSGRYALYLILLFCLVAIYAPFFASSKPFFLIYNQEVYFPLFRYLLYSGFYTKRLDIFFNLMIFTFPLFLLSFYFLRGLTKKMSIILILLAQLILFVYFAYFSKKDPAADPILNQKKQEVLKTKRENDDLSFSWDFELHYMNDYAKLNLLLKYLNEKENDRDLVKYAGSYFKATQQNTLPTLWQVAKKHADEQIKQLEEITKSQPVHSTVHEQAQEQLSYLLEKEKWLSTESQQIQFRLMPFLSHFHWEDDAGGQQTFNQYLPWWYLTRTNRKDLLSALIFGIRISLVVGITAVALALIIGLPIGSLAGFYGGRFDMIVSRLIEIWEAMPAFFMLMMVVAFLQSKSIFLIISVIGFFGWTTFSRYVRGEFFKQRNLPYVEACYVQGFKQSTIMFKHILPNAIPPILTLLPFAMMGAITSEAGLSFLGLGEEASCSWGVLMDEGRTAFPQESYLLWPPAILLTLLLISIALVGDALRDALDPKLR